MDSTPVYSNETANDATFMKHVGELPLNKPNRLDSIDCYPKIMVTPSSFDFELSRHGRALENKTLVHREDDEQISLLKQLGADKFSESEEEIYRMLSLVEKHIGWEALVKIRDELFEKGANNDWDNPKVAAECSKDDDSTQVHNQDSVSFAVIRNKGSSNVRQLLRGGESAFVQGECGGGEGLEGCGCEGRCRSPGERRYPKHFEGCGGEGEEGVREAGRHA